MTKASKPCSPTAVSVVIPCRNEAQFIRPCLESILGNDYPADQIEILVIDGMSTDGTRELVSACSRVNPRARLLDNPRRITPCALNIGISAARGEFVIRMDAHATYAPDYIRKCIDALERYGVDDVGGIWRIVPRGRGAMARAGAAALAHPFGVGNAAYRLAGAREPVLVDTVPFFCCRRETLLKVGPFNEKLVRHQDMEFNVRLRRLGGRILLVPGIVTCYHARTDLRSFSSHGFRDGESVILAMFLSDVLPVALRHLVPMAFVGALVTSLAALAFTHAGAWAFAAIAGLYLSTAIGAAMHAAIRRRDPALMPTLPLMFAALHFGYGAGSFVGLGKALRSRLHLRRAERVLTPER